jgi:hypothetical protein
MPNLIGVQFPGLTEIPTGKNDPENEKFSGSRNKKSYAVT